MFADDSKVLKQIWSPAEHSPVFCVCSHFSGHGVAAAVVAVKFPEPGLAASVIVVTVAESDAVEHGLAGC